MWHYDTGPGGPSRKQNSMNRIADCTRSVSKSYINYIIDPTRTTRTASAGLRGQEQSKQSANNNFATTASRLSNQSFWPIL